MIKRIFIVVRNIVINKGYKECEIMPYSDSGYEFYNGKYGRFQEIWFE